MLAEANTSTHTLAITLTYGRKGGQVDHFHSTNLVYHDVQNFLKLYRKNYGKCSYFCSGEYGTKKGRAHWHLILFAKRKPDWPTLKIFHDDTWIHGHMFMKEVQKGDHKEMTYVAKYAVKDTDKRFEEETLAHWSTRPPLGIEFFKKLAKQYVKQGIVPKSPNYRIPGQRTKKGQSIEYYMRGILEETFVSTFVEEWYKAYPNRLFEGNKWLYKVANRIETKTERKRRLTNGKQIKDQTEKKTQATNRQIELGKYVGSMEAARKAFDETIEELNTINSKLQKLHDNPVLQQTLNTSDTEATAQSLGKPDLSTLPHRVRSDGTIRWSEHHNSYYITDDQAITTDHRGLRRPKKWFWTWKTGGIAGEWREKVRSQQEAIREFEDPASNKHETPEWLRNWKRPEDV